MVKKISTKNMCLLLFVVFVAQGTLSCSHAQKIDFPDKKKRVALRGRRIVVSNFLMVSNYRFSNKLYSDKYTTTYEITKKRKSRDVSRALAYYLKRRGIRARSARKIRLKSLRRNEVLLVGVISSEGKPMIHPVNAVLMTAFIGAILPNPFGFKLGADVKYTWLLVDRNKRVVYRSGMKKGEVFHKWYYVWSVLGYKNRTYYEKSKRRMILEVFKDIRGSLGR